MVQHRFGNLRFTRNMIVSDLCYGPVHGLVITRARYNQVAVRDLVVFIYAIVVEKSAPGRLDHTDPFFITITLRVWRFQLRCAGGAGHG